MQQANEIFVKNLKALESCGYKIVEKVKSHEASDIDFIMSQTDLPVSMYNGIPLHNLVDPLAEAELIYKKTPNSDYNSLIILFGIGTGHLFKHIAAEHKGVIIVFEPNLDILRSTLETVDLSAEISNKKVWVVCERKHIRPVFLNNFYRGDTVGMTLLPAYNLLFPEIIEELSPFLQDLYRDSSINQYTVVNKAEKWSLAAMYNIFDILKAPNVYKLKDRLTGVPAVIVSAGPSLDYTLPLLKELQDKVFIVAIGQALKALDRAGIVPHMVVAIENLNVSQQFENISFLKDITLAVQPMTHRSLYELPLKRLMINFPDIDLLAKWFSKKTGRDVTGFPNRGTVSICGYYIAHAAGCNPIILTGQDLAYREGKRYADNTAYDKLKYTVDDTGKVKYTYDKEAYEKIGKTFGMTEEEFAQKNRNEEQDVITVPGWDGETLLTNASYSLFINSYTDIAESELCDTDIRLINCSKGGAYIKGLEHLDFSDAIKESNIDHGKDINAILDKVFEDNKYTDEEVENLKSAIWGVYDDMQKGKSLAEKASSMCKKISDYLNNPQKYGKKIDKLVESLTQLDHELIPLVRNNQLLNPFIQAELFEYSRTYAREENEVTQNDKVQSMKENMKHSLNLYNAILNGSNRIIDLIPKVLEQNNLSMPTMKQTITK